jgi:hypothetical protein
MWTYECLGKQPNLHQSMLSKKLKRKCWYENRDQELFLGNKEYVWHGYSVEDEDHACIDKLVEHQKKYLDKWEWDIEEHR